MTSSKYVRPNAASSRYHHQRKFRLHVHLVHPPKRRSSMAKTKIFSIIASINKSIQKCKYRLVKFFSKFARKRHHYMHQGYGYAMLKKEETFIESNIGNGLIFEFPKDFPRQLLLPPLVSNKKRTIVLDLDETLVHARPDPPPSTYDFIIKPTISGVTMKFYVLKRPKVDEFLKTISKNYEVVVFTAGLQPYASMLLDILDPKGLMISHRLYRDSCKQVGIGKYVKDLSKTGRDLTNVVIVDDNPKSYSLQPENAIRIKRFEDDIEDKELEKLMVFFEIHCRGYDDMRDAVKVYNTIFNQKFS